MTGDAKKLKEFSRLFKILYVMKCGSFDTKDVELFQAITYNYYEASFLIAEYDLDKFFKRFNDYQGLPKIPQWKQEIALFKRERENQNQPDILTKSEYAIQNNKTFRSLQMVRYWQFMTYDKETRKPKYPDAFNALGRYHIQISQILNLEPVPWFTQHVYNYDPDEIIEKDDPVMVEQFPIWIKKIKHPGKSPFFKLSELFIK